MSQQPQQPEWNVEYQRYLCTHFDDQYQRWYWKHHEDGQGWIFFQWCPPTHRRTDSAHTIRQGLEVCGSYDETNPRPNSHYEPLDPSFRIMPGSYFQEGKMFSILFTEPAGANALNRVTHYNSALSQVKYGEFAHTQIRRFIIVNRRRGHCYAIPVFTYGGRGTLKPGVVPDEHAIAYSYGSSPRTLPGEQQFSKSAIPIVMNPGEDWLEEASRIFFGIHHPIQYNVKVKDLGYVHTDWMPTFLGYWNMENAIDTQQSADVTNEAAGDDKP